MGLATVTWKLLATMMVVVTEQVFSHRVGRRVYRQPTGPHPIGVYAPRWPGGRWWVQVTIGGETFYGGVVDSMAEGAALVAAYKRQMGVDREQAEVPQPVVTRKPPPPSERAERSYFGR